MMQRLDFSIGPVQRFVAQSRRTRDLWSSSYLLAYLSAHALRAALDKGAALRKPNLDGDPLYAWVCGHRDGPPPAIGSVPNHFAVAVTTSPRAVAEHCIAAFNAAWLKVCDAVWSEFFAPVAHHGYQSKAVWDRQVNGFWEIQWTAGDDDPLVAGLQRNRRKQWQAHLAAAELGSKCSMMYDYQELSGYIPITKGPKRSNYWEAVYQWVNHRESNPPAATEKPATRDKSEWGDIRRDERLCAVAAVKRLFPLIGEKAIGWRVEPSRWLSTVDIAAQPWLSRVAAIAPIEAAAFCKDLLKHAPGARRRLRARLAGNDPDTRPLWECLDANCFHSDSLEDEKMVEFSDDKTTKPEKKRHRQALKQQLLELIEKQAPNGEKLGPPPNAYAVILADGDRLGELAKTMSAEEIGAALNRFTRKVPEIANDYGALPIYAGGDDVLLLLPVPRALGCAAALADKYRSAFAETNPDAAAKATLSAAVVFGHIRLPLTMVLDEAHWLLDDIAKKENGRNSLAVSLFKSGGRRALWTSTWQRSTGPAVTGIEQLAACLRGDSPSLATDRPGELSTSLLFRLRETLSVLGDGPSWTPGQWIELPPGTDLRGFLHAEIVRGLACRGESDHQGAAPLTDLILGHLGPARAGQADPEVPTTIGMDGLLVARFLAYPKFQEDVG